jgi:hypothetical protein
MFCRSEKVQFQNRVKSKGSPGTFFHITYVILLLKLISKKLGNDVTALLLEVLQGLELWGLESPCSLGSSD